MRYAVLPVLALVSCTTRTDAPTDVQAPQVETPACSDVATATLHLGQDTPPPLEACEAGVVAVGLSQTARWILTADALTYEGGTLSLGDIHGTDVAAGYGATAFVLDGRAGTVYRAEDGAFAPLVADAALVDARALVRVGGTLYVATPRGVSTVALGDGSVAVLRQGLDALDLTVDDIGALLVLTPQGLVRMLPSGDDAPLTVSTLQARRIAFDLVRAQLLTIDDAGAVQHIDYANVVPEGPSSRPTQHGDMVPFQVSGFILAGAEYWPHRGSTPAEYPEEILWGFYPSEGEVFEGAPAVATATEAAVACAEQSYAALKAWIPTATEALTKATAGGKAPRFYLWVNDYTEAEDPFPTPMRQAKLWYWARDPAVAGRIPGYFKWETVVDQKGACSWPQPEQAAAFLEDAAQSAM